MHAQSICEHVNQAPNLRTVKKGTKSLVYLQYTHMFPGSLCM